MCIRDSFTQQQPPRRHAWTESESRQGRNNRHGEGARTLSESRPRCPLEGLAKSARIHLRKNHRSTWSKHYLLCPGHRQPRTAYGNHLGSAQNCAHPAAGIAVPARVEAINCDGCWRRTTQSFHAVSYTHLT